MANNILTKLAKVDEQLFLSALDHRPHKYQRAACYKRWATTTRSLSLALIALLVPAAV